MLFVEEVGILVILTGFGVFGVEERFRGRCGDMFCLVVFVWR